MDAAAAARALKERLTMGAPKSTQMSLTVADAAARSGLSLEDARQGLFALLREYRGHLSVTGEGELIFRFVHGFEKPWETRTKIQAALDRSKTALLGVLRFVVRAWVSIVLIAYALIFLGVIFFTVFARSEDSRGRDRDFGFGAGYVLFRIVAEALFWTFHPFSPFALSYEPTYARREFGRRSRKKEETPFYESVNRFFFGPSEVPRDPSEDKRRILDEIRAQKGRIGLGDVMRVTGLARDEADPLMARLLLEYDGSIDVSEEGGIVYRFESLRKTAIEGRSPRRQDPVWAKKLSLPPLSGNGFGTNLIIAGLNGFNLIMSLYAIDLGLTIERLRLIAHGIPWNKLPPADGAPIALGLVPLVFSIALFALPLARGLYRPLKQRALARENARRAVLREILTKGTKGELGDASLAKAIRIETGREPSSKELSRVVVAYGGDAEISEEGEVRYRFPELEAEARALEAERAAASDEEARIGEVIFSSDR